METTNLQETKVQAASFLSLCDAAARRMLDIGTSAIGLFILSPLFLTIAILIKRDSRGPIFYFGPRLGRNGKEFGIVKFRTMFESQESYQGPRITASGDCRITPLGRWLRDTKINELPQLWNVLKGDMSLVGPRPEDPEIAKAWPASQRDELLSVRPGITSPATVVFRGEEAMLQSSNIMDDYLRSILPNKLRLDCNYIQHRNLLTDLDVIFMTLLLLLPRLRKTEVPETALYWGPIAKFASRNLNWLFLDTVVAFFAMGVSAFLWRLSMPLNIGLINWIAISVGVGLCFSLINAGLGLTKIQWRRAPSRDAIRLAFSTVSSTVLLMFADQFFLPHMKLPLGMLAITGVLSFSGFTFLRYRERLLTGFASVWLGYRGTNRAVGEKVLLVGAGSNSQLATWFLTHSEFARMFTIVGIIDDDPRKQGLFFDGFRVVGTTRDIPALVKKYNVGITIYTITNIEWDERQRILRTCQAAQTRVVDFPDVMAELASYFQAAPVNHQPQYSTIGD